MVQETHQRCGNVNAQQRCSHLVSVQLGCILEITGTRQDILDDLPFGGLDEHQDWNRAELRRTFTTSRVRN